MINRAVGRRIKELREKTVFTTSYIAKYLNVSEEAYEKIELGTYKGKDELFIIVVLSYLHGVSVDYILGRVDEYGKKTFRNDEEAVAFLDNEADVEEKD